MDLQTSVPREPRIHGDVMFPLSVYFVVLTRGPLQQFVTHHWHEEAEYVYATKGTVDVQVDKRTYSISAGQAVFVHGGEIHTMAAADDGDSECAAVVFNMEMLSSGYHDAIQHQYVGPLLEGDVHLPTLYSGDQTCDQRVLSCLNSLIQQFANQPAGYQLEIKALLYLILSTLAAHDQVKHHQNVDSIDKQNLWRLKTVLGYIDNHSTQKIRLKDLANLINMSEGHFCRYFKRMTNKRPVEYLNEHRVNRAAYLLQTTNAPIMDIAFDVGFDNISYFIRVFRSIKQCTPSDYRRVLSETTNR